MTDDIYHFIGVGGIGMSALARLLLQKGQNVQGTDQQDTPLISELQKEGVQIQIGHNEAHLGQATTVVYSSAIDENNPEILRAKLNQLNIIHRSDLLSKLMTEQKSLLVTGTHGKTSTSALLAWTLDTAGLCPSFSVGGVLKNYHTNARSGSGQYFVAEGDESDGSFLKHPIQGAIITNLEPEHLDFWGTKEALFEAFQTFTSSVDENPLVWCYDDPNLRKMDLNGISYGFDKNATFCVENIRQLPTGIIFDIRSSHQLYRDIFLSTLGFFNALNACSVFALALQIGVEEEDIRKAFKSFKGVVRRLDQKAHLKKTDFYDDYAHHPTEVQSTLRALRSHVQQRRIVAIFQPHRYSRTLAFFEQFLTSFSDADLVFITDVYSAGEAEIDRNLAQELVGKLNHPACRYIAHDQLEKVAKEILRPHDVVITMGAGNISTIGNHLTDVYQKQGKKWKVGLAYGGSSPEHSIACVSAKYIRESLDPECYEIQDIYIHEKETMQKKILEKFFSCDICMPIFHGPQGEDGMIQGFLEFAQIPYTGSDYAACSLTMNKDWTKAIASQYGIQTAQFVVLQKEDAYLEKVRELRYPLWVKAVHLGSSIGVYRVKDEKELSDKIEQAFLQDNRLIVEEEVIGRQIEFGLIGNSDPLVLPSAEILNHGSFHDYESKYGEKATACDVPANIDINLLKRGEEIACQLYKACGLSGFARIDLFLDNNDRYWFNEINPIPGMTPTSPFPIMWEKSDHCSVTLADQLVIYAISKYKYQINSRAGL